MIRIIVQNIFSLFVIFLSNQNPSVAMDLESPPPLLPTRTLKPAVIKELSDMAPESFCCCVNSLYTLALQVEGYSPDFNSPFKSKLEGLVSARWSELFSYLETLDLNAFCNFAHILFATMNHVERNVPENPFKTKLRGLISTRWKKLLQHLETQDPNEFCYFTIRLYWLANAADYNSTDSPLKTSLGDVVLAKWPVLFDHLKRLPLEEICDNYASSLCDVIDYVKGNFPNPIVSIKTRLNDLMSIKWDQLFNYFRTLPLEEFYDDVSTFYSLTYRTLPVSFLLAHKCDTQIKALIALRWEGITEMLSKMKPSKFLKYSNGTLRFVESTKLMTVKRIGRHFPVLPCSHEQTKKGLVDLIPPRLSQSIDALHTAETLEEFLVHTNELFYPLKQVEENPGPLTQTFTDVIKTRLLTD